MDNMMSADVRLSKVHHATHVWEAVHREVVVIWVKIQQAVMDHVILHVMELENWMDLVEVEVVVDVVDPVTTK